MAKKGKILLISPNLKGINGGLNRIQPGLGIGYLAAVLERDGQHEVHVRDTALEGHQNTSPIESGRMIVIGESDDSLAHYVANLRPDIVGISVLFSNLADHAHAVARIVKKVSSQITVVLGGNHLTNAVRDYRFATAPGNESSNLDKALLDIEDPNIDYGMTGESDFQFAKLVNALLNDQDVEGIDGLVYKRKDGGISISPNPPERVDVRQLPHPARHLMNMEGYFKIGLFHSSQSRSSRVLNVMASRGCPEKCTFCTTPDMWGSKVRWRDPLDIYAEIKDGIEQYGIGEVQFEDDTSTAHITHLMELCDLLKPLDIPWCTPNGTKVNYHVANQPDMYRRMAEAGCYQITLACESGVQRVLDDIIRKNLKLDQIKPAINNAKEAGLIVHTFWIVGYPGETREEMEQTIEFAAASGADTFSLAILTPLPGTPIYRKVVKENLWWDSRRGIKDMVYRNSLVRVDGFDRPDEFERWVEEKNFYLNELLEKNDPARAQWVMEKRGAKGSNQGFLKIKQT